MIEVEGGKVRKTESCARSRGTTVSVRNLFYNTPARLKFLKSRETEFSHIAGFVESLALSFPECSFTLSHAGRTEFRTNSRDPRARIRDLFGEEIADSLKIVSAGRQGIEVMGYLSGHPVTSNSAKSLYLFVNGRVVRDRTIQHAVLAGYENLLMKHRYPWVFLYLSVPPQLVDVNVHPTKAEVRFANASVIHDLVREGVRRSLGAGDSGPARARTEFMSTGGRNPGQDPHEITPPNPPLTLRGGLSSDLKILGQVHSTYLLCETGDQLILIDQHAAHERIGFEKLKKQFESGGVARQALLLPESFDLKPSEAEILRLYLKDLEKFGLEIGPFGPSSFILRAVPALLAGENCVGLVTDLMNELQAYGKLTPLDEKVHEILETIACHAQVRAGDRLTNREIEALIVEMERTNFSTSCPHGRPSVLSVPFGEIEKWFKRKL